MYGIKIIFLVFTTVFFTRFSYADINYTDLSLRWSSVYSFEMNDHYLTSEAIKKPAGTRVVLGSFKFLTTDFKTLKDCLIYQIPTKEVPGKLYVMASLHKEDCRETTFKKSILESREIYNLSFSYRKSEVKLNVDKKTHSFIFFNVINNTKENKTNAYGFTIPGVEISFIDTYEVKTRLQEFEVCSNIAKSCGEKPSENLCHLCPGLGTYQVYASDCKKSIRSYCGIKKCGERNSPACIRGRSASGYKGPFCITDSPLGFCRKPFRVLCINNELLCR
jgi:hypothetical protein